MRIWCDFKPDGNAAALLRAGAGGHEVIFKAEGAVVSEADVAMGQPEPEELMHARRVKWVHITSAGYTKFDRRDFWETMRAQGTVVTNSSGVFADACAQHALAMMMGFARGLPWGMMDQREGRWEQEKLRRRSFLLNEQRVVIFGFGAIARRLADFLKPMTGNVVGVRRNVRGDEGIAMVATAESDGELARADHVVNILPLSKGTEDFFGAERFGRMKAGAYFYNIGRGRTVDQGAMVAALDGGKLAGAYLDVVEPEPLPAGHALWTAKNCFVTPHSAGGFVGETEKLVGHFLGNLRRWERGESLMDRITI